MSMIRIDWSAGRRRKVWRTVEAVYVSPCGRFAIHRTPEAGWPDRWRVTHIPTGYAIILVKAKIDAVRAVRELEATKGPWASKSRKLIHARLGARVRPIISRYDMRYKHLSGVLAERTR